MGAVHGRDGVSRPAAAPTVLLLFVLAFPAFAAPRDSLRPRGEITVTADRAEWEKGGVMLYTGNVQMASDTLKLNGERLELKQFKPGEFTARLTGAPARLQHTGDPSGGAETAQPVDARGKQLDYDSRSGVVEIGGGARLVRGTDEVTGERISYDVNARRIRAAGGSGGQVKIVIQPPPPKGKPAAGATKP